jgi:hypothetical protein
MSTTIEICTSKSNLIVDVYVNGKWFKQIIPEGNLDIDGVLNCVADSLKRDEDYGNI